MLLKNTAFIVFIIIIIFAGIVYFALDFGLLSCCNREIVPDTEEELSTVYETTFTVGVGESITINLESNPTTGFQWQIGYDPEKLELVSQDFIAPEETGLVGASGEEMFVLEALMPGESEITFLYSRPWETDVEPEKVLYYKAIVKE